MVTQVTDGVRSGHLAKGLDFIGDITLREEARASVTAQQMALSSTKSPEAQGAKLCQWVKERAALGVSGERIRESSVKTQVWLGRQQANQIVRL